MLTPKQLQEIVETMQPMLDDLNVWITKDIIKRVMARLGRGEDMEMTSTDVWQAQVYRNLGGHYEALQRQLIAFTEASEEEIRQIFQYAGLTAYDADAKMYHQGGLDVPPLRQSPRILQVLEDTYRRTNGELRNFTRTTATATQQRLIQALDKAHIMVMSGATSYATAVREVVNELAEHQAYVRYPTGHTDTLEVAVLRAVRTGTAQASGNMSVATMEQYGWEIVLTSAHLGARYGDGGQNPGNHFWWQGRFFSRTGKDKRFPPFIESTGYGTGEGLCGWNCRHSFGPGDGVHNPWMKYDAQANKEAYDLSQIQRKKEREIRSQTKKVEAFKEAVDAAQSDDVRKVMQEALKDEQGKLTSLRKDYGNFCDENDLKRQAFRLQVAKVRQQEAEKAYYSQPATSSGLTGSRNDDRITPYQKTGDTEVQQLCELKPDVLEEEFGKLNTTEVVLTDERIQHIRDHHPQDYELFEAYGIKTITEPDAIIRDMEHDNTVFMVSRLENTNLNAIVRLSVSDIDSSQLKNSVMTFYRIRTKNLVKLMKKHKVLYNRDKIWYNSNGEEPK